MSPIAVDMSSYLAAQMGEIPLISPESTVRAGLSQKKAVRIANRRFTAIFNTQTGAGGQP